MPINVPRIVIIDDNRQDGIKIAEAIWSSGYPARYLEYPADVASTGANKFIGVRVLFMDMDLIGDQFVGDRTKNYSAVQSAIQACLGDSNGPYILITWSTYDVYAEELITFLNERMPVVLQPAYCRRLDKEDLENLSEKVSEYLSDMGPTGCLINWEKCIVNAASETLHGLIDLSRQADGVEQINALTRLIYDISRAEAGDNLTEDNATDTLYFVLSQLLHDNNLHQISGNERRCSELIYSGRNLDAIANIHQKINAMLHLETKGTIDTAIHSPGDAFNYPVGTHGLTIPEININEFLKEEFKNIRGDLNETDLKEMETNTKLLLVEITPQCDFSNNKHTWNKYVVTAQIPVKFNNSKSFEYLFKSPKFRVNNGMDFRLFFNSKLVLSLPKGSNLDRRLFRIRQPLLGDMMGWLARQSSRLGHVSIE